MPGMAWHGTARHGMVWRGAARRGVAWGAWRGVAWRGMVHGIAWCMAWHGTAQQEYTKGRRTQAGARDATSFTYGQFPWIQSSKSQSQGLTSQSRGLSRRKQKASQKFDAPKAGPVFQVQT